MIYRISIILIFLCFSFNVYSNSLEYNDTISTNNNINHNYTDSNITKPSKINKTRLAIVSSSISGTYIGMMSFLQYVWYKDHKRVPFHFYKDEKGYNQIDKCGHVYGSYMQSYVSFQSLLWAGVSRKKAALYGGSVGFVMQLPIEIWDGIYEGWGFSLSDIGANAIGSALIIGQELAFQEQIVKYKFSFYPSPYAKQANGYLGEGIDQLLYDYNAHTYWLSTGISKITNNKRIPEWINIAFGYSANGMFGEFTNKTKHNGVVIPTTERTRQYLLSLDIDFTKIPTKNKTLKKILNSMFFVKIPFPTIEINSKSEFKFHPLYF